MLGLLAATTRELAAWNAGAALGFCALALWVNDHGVDFIRRMRSLCRGCGRSPENCSCVDVVFTPWEEDDDE